MRRRFALLFIGVALAATQTAWAGPPTDTPQGNAGFAGTWLGGQVNDQGFIPQAGDPAKPNLSATAQAVIAMETAGVANAATQRALTYLGEHVDEYVVHSGNDDPGALAFLIMAAAPRGYDVTDFGSTHANLLARLQATKQSNGLFGAADPSFDGAFRQGLALMALKVAGASDTAAVDWLIDQQCADGLWTAFRADTTQPCPAVDPATFTGPDTNSSALAVLGLQAQGSTTPAGNGAAALLSVRNSGGGWGFLARSDQPTDANSTGLVVSALLAADGTQDARGVAALEALQVGCDGEPSDRGGIAFQDLTAGPDALATAQATPALAGKALPLPAQSGPFTADDRLASCDLVTTTTEPPPTSQSGPAVEGEPLPRTGSSSLGEVGGALVLVGVGVVFVTLAEARRRRTS